MVMLEHGIVWFKLDQGSIFLIGFAGSWIVNKNAFLEFRDLGLSVAEGLNSEVV